MCRTNDCVQVTVDGGPFLVCGRHIMCPARMRAPFSRHRPVFRYLVPICQF